MNVEQLIEELQKLPKDALVLVLPDENWYQTVIHLRTDRDGDVVIYTKAY